MERNIEIKFRLVFILSFFIHVIIMVGIYSSYYTDLLTIDKIRKRYFNFKGRDIIVNINQDKKSRVDKTTLLSDKDSTGKGYLTRTKGDNWLNNSMEFKVKKGTLKAGKTSTAREKSKNENHNLIKAENSHIEISLLDRDINITSPTRGKSGKSEWNKIPDRKGINLKNSIYITNEGKFTFNTKKYKNFNYFRRMKNKIGRNWNPPESAFGILPKINQRTGSYTPGRIRIKTESSQIIKLYFTMNRRGDVTGVRVLESTGDSLMNKSCIKAIQNSRNFGRVPSDIPGEPVVIPFIFGYYVR